MRTGHSGAGGRCHTVTSAPARHRVVELSTADLRGRLDEALALYVAAMRYPIGTERARSPMWLSHMSRAGWRCFGAFNGDGTLTGITYGYLGRRGQWWHDQVYLGLRKAHGAEAADSWMSEYFELTELHVLPGEQGSGLGERLLRRLLAQARTDGSTRVLLSTPEGPTRAWRLYRRVGFCDVLRRYNFAGDPRPFAVLGVTLPLVPSGK